MRYWQVVTQPLQTNCMSTQVLTQTQRQRWIARTINTIAASQGIYQQRDLARVIGWTETKLSRKLHQEVRFSLEDVDHVAARLDVDTAELLNGWNSRVPIPDDEVVVPLRGLTDTGSDTPAPDTGRYATSARVTTLRAVA